MSAVYKRGRAVIAANLTPMIDVTFLLIVFFILVSQVVKAENVKMDLPRPHDPKTMTMPDERRIVINVVPGKIGSEIASYAVGTRSFAPDLDGVDAMIDYIASLYQENPELNINLRADRGTHYELIEPAMHAITLAANRAGNPEIAPRINLVVIRDEN